MSNQLNKDIREGELVFSGLRVWLGNIHKEQRLFFWEKNILLLG